MPNVSSVNISSLHINKAGSVNALWNLADFANGPLRLQKKVENGKPVIYLGVRSWSTYFFEKVIATPAQIANAKIKTQAAIDKHVRHLLMNGGRTLGRDPNELTAALQSKVVGKSVTPAPIFQEAVNQKGSTSTRPSYKAPSDVVKTKGKAFNGVTTVPAGLSVAVFSPLKVIADVRLVTDATFKTHPSTDERMGVTRSQGNSAINNRSCIKDYKQQYLASLKYVEGMIQTSVVLEVQPDSEAKCSNDNLEGACQAAADFVQLKKLQGQHVSVMLTVPELPSVTRTDSATVKVISTAPNKVPHSSLLVERSDEASEESSS